MDKDIQALIEREAEKYAERIKKNTLFNLNERIAATVHLKVRFLQLICNQKRV